MLLSRLIQFVFFSTIFDLIKNENQFYRISPHDISALIGSNITIPCVIAPPHGDVQWTKDGLALGFDRQLPAFPSWSIIGNEPAGEFNFFIQSLKHEDEGLFACEVSPYNDALPLKHIAHVRTLARPERVQINPPNQLVSIRFDETIRQIDCQVDGAKPPAHIKWMNETGEEFPATSRIVPQDRLFSTISTLTLVPSASLHKKRFICDVQHETLTNETQPFRTSFEIQITSPPNLPQIHGYASTNRLSNGSSLLLSCQTSNGSPLANISWYRLENQQLELIDNSSSMIEDQNLAENNLSLIIRPADNNATYSCQVTNDYLQAIGQIFQINVTLHVAFGPASVVIGEKDGNGTTILMNGIPRQFICRISSSNPRPIVTWKLDQQILPPDINPLEESGDYGGIRMQLTKTIGLNKPLKSYHGKILSCEATNSETGQILSDSTQLNVIFDAVSIEMQGIDKDQTIKAGQLITTQCILTGGNPIGEIIWYKGNELLQSESTIDSNGTSIISRVNFTASPTDHHLALTCKGQVQNFPAKLASFTMNVLFLPEEIMIVDHPIFSNLTLEHDHCRVFECRTSRSNPQAQLTVYRQGIDGIKHMDIQYKTSNSYVNGMNSIQFTLPPLTMPLHETRLICEATLNIETPPLIKQVSYIIHVNHKPSFSEFKSVFDVTENQSLNITLHATAYPLPISYTWFHPTGQQLSNDSQLSLINIHRNDSGIYRCLASNSLGHTEANFTLNVLSGPTITRTQGYSLSEALIPGSSATLSCVIDGNPVDLNAVRWLKNQQEISVDQWEKRIDGREVSIIRKSIQLEDAGEYTCETTNSFGTNRAILPLFIQYPPKIDRTHINQNKLAVNSDQHLTVEMHCHVTAIPKPTISWFKDNQTLSSSLNNQIVLNERPSSSPMNPFFDTLLTITNITKPDYGIYQCKAENALGSDIIDFTLAGLTIPDPPRDIHVVNMSHSSALISWSPGFNGGANQTFQIRYRLSTASRYFYEHLPIGIEAFQLKTLRLASEYHLNIRANNSYHLSPWSEELIIKTPNIFPRISFHFAEFVSTKMSFKIIAMMGMIGAIILLINILLMIIFFLKRRKTNMNSENLSTTETNETEANTVDLFQPKSTYQKYDEEDMKSPFVSSLSSMNSFQPGTVDHPFDKKIRFSPYDNLHLHQYYPTTFENHLITYRSFKVDLANPSDVHPCVRAELV